MGEQPDHHHATDSEHGSTHGYPATLTSGTHQLACSRHLGADGAEQFALGTEEQWLQENAPDNLWNGLIENAHSIFPGTLTYDMNWSALVQQPRAWMRNPLLKMIGVSAYLPQIPARARLNLQQIIALWKTRSH